MYLNALEFLEEERDAWRPFEALASLTDEQLEVPIDAAHELVRPGSDRAPRRLAGSNALEVAKELAVGETSATKARSDAEWDERGDDMNARHPERVARAADGRGPPAAA